MPKQAFDVIRNTSVLVSGSSAFAMGIFSIILLQKGIDLTQLGFFYMFGSIAVILFVVPVGAFADAYGRRKAIMLGFLFEALYMAGVIFLSGPIMLLPLSIIGALGTSLLYGPPEAYAVDLLIERGGKTRMHELVSTSTIWFQATYIIGSVIGGFVAVFSMDYALVLCVVFGVIGFFYSLFGLSDDTAKRRDFSSSEKDILARMKEAISYSAGNSSLRMLLALSLLFGFAAFGLYNYWQPVMMKIGSWDASNMGLFFAIMMAAVLVGAKISTRIKSDWNFIIIALCALSASLFLSGWLAIPIAVAGLLVLWNFFSGMYGPMYLTIWNCNAPTEIRATANSINVVFSRLGMALFGFMIFFIGADLPQVLWMIGAVALLAGAIIVLLAKPKLSG